MGVSTAEGEGGVHHRGHRVHRGGEGFGGRRGRGRGSPLRAQSALRGRGSWGPQREREAFTTEGTERTEGERVLGAAEGVGRGSPQRAQSAQRGRGFWGTARVGEGFWLGEMGRVPGVRGRGRGGWGGVVGWEGTGGGGRVARLGCGRGAGVGGRLGGRKGMGRAGFEPAPTGGIRVIGMIWEGSHPHSSPLPEGEGEEGAGQAPPSAVEGEGGKRERADTWVRPYARRARGGHPHPVSSTGQALSPLPSRESRGRGGGITLTPTLSLRERGLVDRGSSLRVSSTYPCQPVEGEGEEGEGGHVGPPLRSPGEGRGEEGAGQALSPLPSKERRGGSPSPQPSP